MLCRFVIDWHPDGELCEGCALELQRGDVAARTGRNGLVCAACLDSPAPECAPNARFLVASGVTLTLRPGETRSWYRCEPHEEGWSSEAIRWTYYPGRVVREIDTDGRDCDGRFATHDESYCPLPELRAWAANGELWPVWRRLDSSQRDYTAEQEGF